MENFKICIFFFIFLSKHLFSSKYLRILFHFFCLSKEPIIGTKKFSKLSGMVWFWFVVIRDILCSRIWINRPEYLQLEVDSEQLRTTSHNLLPFLILQSILIVVNSKVSALILQTKSSDIRFCSSTDGFSHFYSILAKLD